LNSLCDLEFLFDSRHTGAAWQIDGSKLKLEQIGAIDSCRKNMTGTEVAETMIYLMEN